MFYGTEEAPKSKGLACHLVQATLRERDHQTLTTKTRNIRWFNVDAIGEVLNVVKQQ